jgi:hypothetical protein
MIMLNTLSRIDKWLGDISNDQCLVQHRYPLAGKEQASEVKESGYPPTKEITTDVGLSSYIKNLANMGSDTVICISNTNIFFGAQIVGYNEWNETNVIDVFKPFYTVKIGRNWDSICMELSTGETFSGEIHHFDFGFEEIQTFLKSFFIYNEEIPSETSLRIKEISVDGNLNIVSFLVELKACGNFRVIQAAGDAYPPNVTLHLKFDANSEPKKKIKKLIRG